MAIRFFVLMFLIFLFGGLLFSLFVLISDIIKILGISSIHDLQNVIVSSIGIALYLLV